jgi:hypothetical protein
MMWHAVCVHAATEDDGALMLPHPRSRCSFLRGLFCVSLLSFCVYVIYILVQEHRRGYVRATEPNRGVPGFRKPNVNEKEGMLA